MTFRHTQDNKGGSALAVAAGKRTALDVKAVAFRRIIGSVREARRNINSPRLLEAYWILLEVHVSARHNEYITQKQLVAVADGVFSAPTISRAVHDLVQQGLLQLVDNPRDGRSGLLLPTREAGQLLESRAEATVALMRALIATLAEVTSGETPSDITGAVSAASDARLAAAPGQRMTAGGD